MIEPERMKAAINQAVAGDPAQLNTIASSMASVGTVVQEILTVVTFVESLLTKLASLFPPSAPPSA